MNFAIKNRRKIFIIIPVIIFLILASAGIYSYLLKRQKSVQQNPSEDQITRLSCLSDNEMVIYNIDRHQSVSPVDIVIKDKESKKEIFKFTIDSVLPVYFPVQPRKCGVYAIKEYNFDAKKSKPSPGFRVELWRYEYNGQGALLLTFAGEDKNGEPTVYYSYQFQIDFLEKLIALLEGVLEDVNYAAIIKEIKTREDVFSLRYKEVINQNPGLAGGYFGLDEWTKDSRYFWGRLADGAAVLGFFRIERDTWKVDIFLVPVGTQGGDALNSELGYVTYDDGAPWSGDTETDEMYRQQWEKEGKKVHFYLYNLLTKEQILLATIDDPRWNFKPRWISDTELEYYLPNEEKKIYKIDE